MFTASNILINPSSGSGSTAPRYLIIAQLTSKMQLYAALGSIKFVSSNLKNNNLMVHLQIRSETHDNIWYDLVYKFLKIDNKNNSRPFNGVSIKNTEMRVFSNSPEFVFTYAYSFNTRGYIIPEYKQYLGSKALTLEPKVRNPNLDTGISTSLFIGLKYLEISEFFGNYQYLKFINNITSKPLTFNIIYKKIKEQNNLKRKSKHKKK